MGHCIIAIVSLVWWNFASVILIVFSHADTSSSEYAIYGIAYAVAVNFRYDNTLHNCDGAFGGKLHVYVRDKRPVGHP